MRTKCLGLCRTCVVRVHVCKGGDGKRSGRFSFQPSTQGLYSQSFWRASTSHNNDIFPFQPLPRNDLQNLTPYKPLKKSLLNQRILVKPIVPTSPRLRVIIHCPYRPQHIRHLRPRYQAKYIPPLYNLRAKPYEPILRNHQASPFVRHTYIRKELVLVTGIWIPLKEPLKVLVRIREPYPLIRSKVIPVPLYILFGRGIIVSRPRYV